MEYSIIKGISPCLGGEKDMRKILIESTQTNPRDCSYGLPWDHDSNCYNFRTPVECVTVSNIEKIVPEIRI